MKKQILPIKYHKEELRCFKKSYHRSKENIRIVKLQENNSHISLKH